MPNIITPWGHDRIKHEIATCSRPLHRTPQLGLSSGGDMVDRGQVDTALLTLSGTVERWQEILTDMQIMTPAEQADIVRIGNTVTVEIEWASDDDDISGGREQRTFTIGASQESDPYNSLYSYQSPMAQAVMGKSPQTIIEDVYIGTKRADEVTILSIQPPSAPDGYYDKISTSFPSFPPTPPRPTSLEA